VIGSKDETCKFCRATGKIPMDEGTCDYWIVMMLGAAEHMGVA